MWVGTVMTPWKLCLGALLALAVACGLMALVTMPAKAQQQPFCASKKQLLHILADRYGEHPMLILESPGGGETILTVSEQKTWTLIFVDPQKACAVRVGTSIRRDAGI